MKKLLSYLFTLFLLLPSVLAQSSAGTVAARFTIFYEGIKGAITGNPAMFAVGMVAILPLIGVIVIVFGLMFFVTKITIFKSPEHDRYARMIAFGIALIGLAQQKVFNTILGLSTSFLILVFVLAVIFIFIMFVNHNRKAHLTSHAELHKITGDSLKARRDLEKIKHELKHEQALYHKTEKDLKTLDNDLNNITHLVGDELAQVDRLAQMLRKAAAAHQSGNSPAVDQYVTALSKDLGGLITTMQHEQKHDVHLGEMVSKIESELARWGHTADKEKSEEEHLKSLFHKFAHTWGHKIDDKEMKEIYKKDEKLQHHLFSLLKNFRSHLHQLQALYDRIIAETENLEKSSYQRKHLEANAVRDNIMNQQFAEAHKHLDNLRAIIEYEPHVIRQLKAFDSEILHMISKVDEEQKKINRLIQNDILKKLMKLRKKATKKEGADKDKEKIYETFRHKFSNSLFGAVSLVLGAYKACFDAEWLIPHKKFVPMGKYHGQMVDEIKRIQDPIAKAKAQEIEGVASPLFKLQEDIKELKKGSAGHLRDLAISQLEHVRQIHDLPIGHNLSDPQKAAYSNLNTAIDRMKSGCGSVRGTLETQKTEEKDEIDKVK